MTLEEAIQASGPDVWLTSFYGFDTEDWGMLGFTKKIDQKKFIEETEPGVLVVVYNSSPNSRGEYRKILGIQQCSHQSGNAKDFMSPIAWAQKSSDPEHVGKWNHALKVTRAWRVTPETRMHVEEFAPVAAATKAWMRIGSYGMRLTPPEIQNISKLDVHETSVYGQLPIVGSSVVTTTKVLQPSRAGPVSQRPSMSAEAEGPKHLYILKLHGDSDAMLGQPANGWIIVKAGFSKSPETRCRDHNKTLPECAFEWKVLCSGHHSGLDPYPDSNHARAGERAMQEALCTPSLARSLGGEFFLADPDFIQRAWQQGNGAAKAYKP